MHPDGRVQRLRPAIGRPGGSAAGSACAPAGRSSPTSRARRGHDLGVLTGADGLAAAVRGRAVLRRPHARRDRRPRRPLARARGRRDVAPRLGARRARRAAGRAAPATAALRLGTFRTLWASKEVDVSPVLQFLRPRQIVELSPDDAERARRARGRPRRGRLQRHARAGRREAARRGPRRLGVPRRGHDEEPANRSPTARGGAPRRRRAARPTPPACGRAGGRGLAETPPSAPLPIPPCTALDGRRARVTRSPRSASTSRGGSSSSRRWSSSPSCFQLVPIVLLAERKVLGRFQHRYGPNRVGPFGAAAADGRHRQAGLQGAVPAAHVDRLAVRRSRRRSR